MLCAAGLDGVSALIIFIAANILFFKSYKQALPFLQYHLFAPAASKPKWVTAPSINSAVKSPTGRWDRNAAHTITSTMPTIIASTNSRILYSVRCIYAKENKQAFGNMSMYTLSQKPFEVCARNIKMLIGSWNKRTLAKPAPVHDAFPSLVKAPTSAFVDQLERIMKNVYPDLKFTFRETPWLSGYTRVCVQYVQMVRPGRNIDIRFYVTQDGTHKWSAGYFLDKTSALFAGRNPSVIRKLFVSGPLKERLDLAAERCRSTDKSRTE